MLEASGIPAGHDTPTSARVSLENLSLEGRFTSTYNGADAAALAALRWNGYCGESNYTVFLCLTHTLGWSASRWRVLHMEYQKHNLTEYEDSLEIQKNALQVLCSITAQWIAQVQAVMVAG